VVLTGRACSSSKVSQKVEDPLVPSRLQPVLPHIVVCGTGVCMGGELGSIAVIWDVLSCGLVHRYSRGGCMKFVELLLP
jgi:hypothetical protein